MSKALWIRRMHTIYLGMSVFIVLYGCDDLGSLDGTSCSMRVVNETYCLEVSGTTPINSIDPLVGSIEHQARTDRTAWQFYYCGSDHRWRRSRQCDSLCPTQALPENSTHCMN